MPSDTPAAQNSIELTEDPTIIKIHIQFCITNLRTKDGNTKSRELSLAVTKLQEATFWIDEHLRLS